MPAGKVLRFDGIKGRGLITPEEGGAAITVHANDLQGDKYMFRPGAAVSYDIEHGDHGSKAVNVRLLDGDSPAILYALPGEMRDEESTSGDVLSMDEFIQEVTELIIRSMSTLSAEQIMELRTHLARFARSHKWIQE
ncbi:cold-shock protein [Actinomadura rugatobispora]|uniref:Cold-shock protein n=1 Tax=Actinomadura rugatobispora TaxID=1994 RepID=A0ABW1A7D4_9ACTN